MTFLIVHDNQSNDGGYQSSLLNDIIEQINWTNSMLMLSYTLDVTQVKVATLLLRSSTIQQALQHPLDVLVLPSK